MNTIPLTHRRLGRFAYWHADSGDLVALLVTPRPLYATIDLGAIVLGLLQQRGEVLPLILDFDWFCPPFTVRRNASNSYLYRVTIPRRPVPLGIDGLTVTTTADATGALHAEAAAASGLHVIGGSAAESSASGRGLRPSRLPEEDC